MPSEWNDLRLFRTTDVGSQIVIRITLGSLIDPETIARARHSWA